MSQNFTKEEIIQHKKRSIRKVNSLLESYISDGSTDLLKKTNLISYWLEDFVKYISFEDKFDSTKLMRYNRGNVLRVNFGFNVGKELGGLHLAVVLDNDNKRNADVITVIPLSSTDGRAVHERSVDLGTELYEKINQLQKKQLAAAQEELDKLTEMQNFVNTTIKLINSPEVNNIDDLELKKKPENAVQYKENISQTFTKLQNELFYLKRNELEIEKMKLGSMAIVNQITTISKQRIYIPKKSTDFLYGISLSESAMNKINDKVKSLYLFE